MSFCVQHFGEVDIDDPFFDSLKADYSEFRAWFLGKANQPAYVSRRDDGSLNGFLYLKVENGPVFDVTPSLPHAKRLKVGTLKIDAHGTRLGERFIKKIFDHALYEGVSEIYVTIFPAHASLVRLFERYGFLPVGKKNSANGTESVLLRRLPGAVDTLLGRYPFVSLHGQSVYLLSLQPQWHTRLLPDSILNNEDLDIVQDISHTNSIHKVYLTAMRGVDNLQRGDVLLIYRTSDGQGPAWYRSVATSVCVVEEYRHIDSFEGMNDFLQYCRSYSVFTEDELKHFYAKRNYPFVIRFSYNIALKKRVNRRALIEQVGLDENAYFGFMLLTKEQLFATLALGKIDEGLVIN